MSEHKKLSPSKRHRFAACAGSIREEARYPDTSGAAAVDGSHTHTVVSVSIDKHTSPLAFVGQTLTDHEGEFVVDRDRAERAKVAYDYVVQRMTELTHPVVKSERKVDPAPVTFRDDLGGTADIQIGSLEDGVYEIADYKDGMGFVEPDAPQMRQYMVGGLAGLNRSNLEKIKTIRLTVIQPKLAAKGVDPVRWKEFDAVEFMTNEVPKLIAEAAATDDPNAPLVPGDHCKFCKHGGACAARTQNLMESSGIKFDNLDVAKQAADKEPTELSDDQLRELVEAAPLLRQLLESAEKEALRRMEAGQNINGLKLVRGRGSRAWAFNDEEMAEKLKKFGIPKESIWETKLVTPAKAEKLRWVKRDGTEKQLSERQLKTLTDEYIEKSDGKLTVAAASDDRPAVTISAAGMFAPVETSEIPDWLKL